MGTWSLHSSEFLLLLCNSGVGIVPLAAFPMEIVCLGLSDGSCSWTSLPMDVKGGDLVVCVRGSTGLHWIPLPIVILANVQSLLNKVGELQAKVSD